MDFGLSPEQELLQQSARDFLARECPTAFVREVMRPDGDGHPRGFHAKLAALGWTGLIIPEAHGGLGLGLLDLAVLAEEMGRAVMPGPFFSSSVLATLALIQGESQEASRLQEQWLPRLADGSAVGTLALLEESDRLDAEGVTATCMETADGLRIDGRKLFVGDAQVADFLIVAARSHGSGADGICLVVVPRGTEGLTITPLESIDQTRRPCVVELDGVEVPRSARLADADRGWAIVQRVQDVACVILAADSLGGAQRALELAVDYAKVRQQFGKPIGSFQAVKHLAAEMVSEIEPARSLVWYAAYAGDGDRAEASRAASLAKARLSDVYSRVANRAVQIHGGIGFTWEHDMHLWFKRAKANELAFGDATVHRERLAQLSQW